MSDNRRVKTRRWTDEEITIFHTEFRKHEENNETHRKEDQLRDNLWREQDTEVYSDMKVHIGIISKKVDEISCRIAPTMEVMDVAIATGKGLGWLASGAKFIAILATATAAIAATWHFMVGK